MNVVEEIEAALARKGIEAATASRLAVGNPSLIKNIKVGQGNVGAVTLQALADVLDLEFYFGPKRINEPTTIRTTNNDFALIPLFDAALAAGTGAVNGDNAPISDLAFHRKWLRSIMLNPARACVARATGESMQPTIQPDDMLLIDLDKKEVPVRRYAPTARSRPAIYALVHEGKARVKRIARPDQSTIILLSDNAEHMPEILTGDDAQQLELTIIGQVRWWGRTISD